METEKWPKSADTPLLETNEIIVVSVNKIIYLFHG